MEPTGQQRKVLEAFVPRARRIAAHSLAQDPLTLLRWTQVQGQIRVERRADDGEILSTSITRSSPPEEQVESAAARVRPLFLQDDGIHYSTVMRALKVLNRDSGPDEQIGADIEQVTSHWKSIDPKSSSPAMIYSMGWSDTDGDNSSETLTNHQLAWAYIYGDSVHRDSSRLQQTHGFPIRERFLAASVLVTRAVLATVNTLNILREMIVRGLLQGLDQHVFDQEVTVDGTEFTLPVESIHVGEPGTELRADWRPGDTPGPEWTKWTEPPP